MTLSIKFTDSPLGATIEGVDLLRDTGGETLDTIRRVLNERAVVVLSDQKIEPACLVGFARKFGELLLHAHVKTVVPECPEIMIVSNIVENGRNIGSKDAGRTWHTDGSYLSRPDMYTFLHGIEIPVQDGRALGNTLYASTAAGYDALDDSMKRKVENLKAVHSFTFHTRNRARQKDGSHIEITEELKDKAPDVVHPVVRTHPVTGRKCLYVSEGHTTHFVGMSADESENLLRELTAHLRRPEFVYSHSWRPGDLVIWDNAATLHRATFDYALPLRRRMHRVATEGAAPF